jgi:hypothetical protein
VKRHRFNPTYRLAAIAVTFLSVQTLCLADFDPDRANFELVVNKDLVIPYRVFAIYVLPGETIRLGAEASDANASTGELTTSAPASWLWTAPAEPGIAHLSFGSVNDRIAINAFVMHPTTAIRNGRLNGYTIGAYPAPLRSEPVYAAPGGFIELNSETADIALSPHFRLSQFPAKQAGGPPKYLTLREELLIKLELLLEHVNDAGIETDSFTVMSGFRTPVYNRAIGNGDHSRHIYGGAADIYIDVAPRDDIMDDLNGDGSFDFRDAQFLYRLANDLFARPENAHLIGGLGVYRSNSAHGPFLHVDARGFRARWGLIP